MMFVFFFLTLLMLNVSLSFQNQDKTDTVNENEKKGYQIIKGYNYNSNKTGYAVETEKEPIFCKTNLIPGLNWMGRGIDLNTLDFFPFGIQSISRKNGFAESVFEFTCNKKQKWTHNNFNNTYDFPDQIDSLRDLSTEKQDIAVSFKKSLIKTKQELALQAGLDFNYAGFGFSASGIYKKVKDSLTERNTFIAFTQSQESIYEIELSNEINFSRKFLYALNKLPAKYENNLFEYQKFLDTFGTHYFVSGKFGSRIILETEIKANFLREKSELDIQKNLETKFKEYATLDMPVIKKNYKLNEDFSRQSSNHFQYFGGRKELDVKQTFEEWEKTVPLKPWLFSGKLKPIYEAIPDAKKAEQIKIAINVALARAEITDIQQSINILKKKKYDSKILKNVETDLENAKNFVEKTQKKFSSKEVEKQMLKIKKLMKMINSVLEVE